MDWENREICLSKPRLVRNLFKMIYRKALNKLAHIDATQRADTRFYEEMQEMLQDTDLYQVEELTQTHQGCHCHIAGKLPGSFRDASVPGYEL